MVRLIPWTSRNWTFDAAVGTFPALLERLRGTPARAADLVAGASDALLSGRPDNTWSVKQHIGHLDDLHELDERRITEFVAGAATLSAADMTNRRTHAADHNTVPADVLVIRFRTRRAALVERMDALTEEQVGATAIHPRLGRPMRLIDWACFVAEHDDHHLAAARRAMRLLAG